MLLTHGTDTDNPGTVPVLAYTLVPIVAFREGGGELTSALVPVLLSRGFRLAGARITRTFWIRPPAWGTAAV
jgi:hypothetical protein